MTRLQGLLSNHHLFIPQSGEPGQEGKKGEMGTAGTPGERGDPGDVGDIGPPGDPGPQVFGPKGDKGAVGAKGENGSIGNPGETAISVMPVLTPSKMSLFELWLVQGRYFNADRNILTPDKTVIFSNDVVNKKIDFTNCK